MRVLVVEDDPGDYLLLQARLERSQERFEMMHVSRLSEALGFATPNWPDAILLDLSLPDSERLETLSRVQETFPGVPVLILTGNDSATRTWPCKQFGKAPRITC